MRNPNFVKPEDESFSAGDESDSGVSTDAQVENTPGQTKRKAKNEKGAKAKKIKSDKLTVEEINELKETEDLYHSNLFRMQIDETLKEVKINNKSQEFIEKWVKTFNNFLQKLPKQDLTKLTKNSDYPLNFAPMDPNIEMTYQPPTKVATYGSYALKLNIRNESFVDVFVTMPNEILKRSDYHNQIYIHKKALYLMHIANKLKEKATLGGNVKVVNWKNDQLKPVLTIEAEDFNFCINAIASEDFFKLNRFVPATNNIKFKKGEESNAPTPHYNFQILLDSTIEKNQQFMLKEIGSHENVRSAIKLLKIWAHQREFDAGFYPFNGFVITFYILYLLKIRKIYPTMSCYQIIRLFWNHLGHSKLDQAGVSLCYEKNLPNQLSVQEFYEFYELVMVDSSGYCNILSLMSPDLYRRVRDECLSAIKMLDNTAVNSFHQLFLTSVPFYIQYDQVVSVKPDTKWFQSIIERHASSDDKVDFHNQAYPLMRKLVLGVLRKGLGDRVSSIVPISNSDSDELIVGFILNPDNAYNIVDKGPQSNEPAAEDFRKFWGSRAEIRRFKDGSITESVLWCPANAPIGEKRLICQKIVTFLLKHHFNIIDAKFNYVASQFDIAVRNIFNEMNETNEERSLAAIRAFDELSKEMRALNDLPLEIVSVLGIDSIFRYADVTPPLACGSVTKHGFINKQLKGFFRAQKVLNGIIQLSPSGKWPDELDAMRRIKGAFYIEIEKRMAMQFPQTAVHINGEYIEAMKNKLLFRLRIVHPKEISLAKEEISHANNLTKLYRDNEQSLQLEFEGTIMPKLTSSLHGLHHQHPSFGPTVAIAKRWLYSQMIDSFLWPDECTELIVAEMILKNVPMASPLQPQTGFLRFLHQLANINPENDMILVNFNDELTSEQIEELENNFQKNRKKFPPLFIATSCDFQNYGIWSTRAPSLNIVHRVKMLAQHSISIVAENFTKLTTAVVKDLFTPSIAGYNFVINIAEEHVKRCDIVMHNFSKFKPVKYEEKVAPPADVSFVELFLKELREAYDEFAVFFYNPIGGAKIAVLWKPTVGETRQFAASNVNGCKLQNGRLRVNTEAILSDIQIIGKGLIASIEMLN